MKILILLKFCFPFVDATFCVAQIVTCYTYSCFFSFCRDAKTRVGGMCDAVPRLHVKVYTRLFEMNLKAVNRNTLGESFVALCGRTWTPGCYSAEHLLLEIVQ